MIAFAVLMVLPLIMAGLTYVIRNREVRKLFAAIFFVLMTVLSVGLFLAYKDATESLKIPGGIAFVLDKILYGIELVMAIYIIWTAFKFRKPILGLLSFAQIAVLTYYEFVVLGKAEHAAYIIVDRFSLLMVMVTSIVGSLICLYAHPYMKKHHKHHPEFPDYSRNFIVTLYLFLTMMLGIVLSNSLTWMLAFWEVTTLFSYLLIRYHRDEEGIRNALYTLVLNVLGGLALTVGIAVLGARFHVYYILAADGHVGLNTMTYLPAMLPVGILMVIACLVKSAQLPFSKWLLGAMTAPTPSSALLHSSTMVKAGVYLLIRMTPLLAGTPAGLLAISTGSLTFLLCAFMANSQTDGKKVLAYSTISNLGLIVACAGIGTYEALWAAIMLILFHAVSKALLFVSVGSVELVLGSRDIEDMHGLITKLPTMTLIMTIGIAGMFLAPFGMLISKWAALQAIVESNYLYVLVFLAYGSAATVVYWGKWLGKILTVLHIDEYIPHPFSRVCWTTFSILAFLVVALCLSFTPISHILVEPYLAVQFPHKISATIISRESAIIMQIMLGLIILFPFGARFFTHVDDKTTSVYMSGANAGKNDNRFFTDSMGKPKRTHISNWYYTPFFGEKKLLRPSVWITACIVIGFAFFGLIQYFRG